jgi:hypothetical protein
VELEAFVQQGWAEHAEATDAVAARLPEGVALVSAAGHLPALGALVVHVLGEHQGRWDDGDALLGRLLGTPAAVAAGDGPDVRSVWRFRAVLRRCAGDAVREAEYAARGRSDARAESDRVRLLAVAASAFLGQGRVEEAARDFALALALAEYGPGRDDPAARALAVTANNMCCELEERPERSEPETALMLAAAAAARRFWEVAGDWRNVERAEYRLSAAHLAAGDPQRALVHARRCLAGCEQHDADPVERFFANERLALAFCAAGDAAAAETSRAAAAACLAALTDAGTREWVQGEYVKLLAALSGC